jgi:hypothetical protein
MGVRRRLPLAVAPTLAFAAPRARRARPGQTLVFAAGAVRDRFGNADGRAATLNVPS